MKYYAIFFSVIILFSCAQKSEMETADQVQAKTMAPAAEGAKAQLASTPTHDIYSDGKTKLIKTVNYRFEVDNVKKNTEAIEVAVRKYPAYISSSEFHLENPVLENKMTVRVQSEFFYELLKEIDLQARFVNVREVKTHDVSKEFVDLESRLKTKREVEQRYMEILRKNAGTIDELLQAEDKIGDLHEEIEATISRINYLKDQVGYSTLNLEFYQTIVQELKAEEPITMGTKFKDALKFGWDGIVAATLALAYLWPLLVVGAGVLLFSRLRRRKNTQLQA